MQNIQNRSLIYLYFINKRISGKETKIRKIYVCDDAKKSRYEVLATGVYKQKTYASYILLYNLIKTIFECNNHKI